MIELDLRYKRLNTIFSQLFNEIAMKLRGQFTRFVDDMSKEYFDNLDWWVEGPASRNNLVSPLFYRFCCIHLVKELIESGSKLERIVCDSAELNRILQALKVNKGARFEVEGPEGELPKFHHYLLKSAKSVLRVWKRLNSQFRAARRTKYLSPVQHKKDLILIDVFVFPGFVTKDRYYNGLWETLNSEQKKRTFFVPTLVMMKEDQFEAAYKELRTADRNFLIKEDYLRFSDLLFSLFHLIRVWFIRPSPQEVMGVDLSPLVREEILSGRGFDSALAGLLNYRFAKRLKEKSFELSLVIDWFENQVSDKGWNAGFNKFYPDVISKGYRGSVPPLLYICSSSPSEVELRSGVLPLIISVIGDGYLDSTKELASSLMVEKAPAFRFKHLWDNGERVSDKSKCTILIALSIFIDESVYILKLVSMILESIDLEEYRFYVSPHPTMSGETLRRKFGDDWPQSFNIVVGVNELLAISDVLISGGLSSICLESVAQGIPVIVVENPFGFSCNSIPVNIGEHLWQSCRTYEDISNCIMRFKNMDAEQIVISKRLSERIRTDYFEPVTKEGVQRFLELELN